MGAVPMFQRSPRWLRPTSRSDLRITWHDEDDRVVVSLWRENVCIATAPLTIGEAASLAEFLVGHLGERAQLSTRT